jgi:hypothetical protein
MVFVLVGILFSDAASLLAGPAFGNLQICSPPAVICSPAQWICSPLVFGCILFPSMGSCPPFLMVFVLVGILFSDAASLLVGPWLLFLGLSLKNLLSSLFRMPLGVERPLLFSGC